jgi:hypothetical protein
MPLQLRRGTNAERQLITPQEGELIYVTDYEIRGVSPLWVGDGVTPGGNPVDSDAGTLSLSDLMDVDVTSVFPQVGDVLKWDGVFFTPQPDLDTQGPGVVAGESYNINILGNDSSIIVNSSTGNILSNEVSTTILRSDSIIPLTGVLSVAGETNVIANGGNSLLRLTRESTSILDADVPYGGIYFERSDPNGKLVTCLMYGTRDGFYLGSDSTGLFPDLKTLTFNNNGNLGVGTLTPSEKLTVMGNAKVSGFVQFGSLTTVERDALTPVNGMVIYNSTNNKFEGYQNSIWINLDDGATAS